MSLRRAQPQRWEMKSFRECRQATAIATRSKCRATGRARIEIPGRRRGSWRLSRWRPTQAPSNFASPTFATQTSRSGREPQSQQSSENRRCARPRCRVDFEHDQLLLPASSIDASGTKRLAADRKIEETPMQQHVLIDVKIEILAFRVEASDRQGAAAVEFYERARSIQGELRARSPRRVRQPLACGHDVAKDVSSRIEWLPWRRHHPLRVAFDPGALDVACLDRTLFVADLDSSAVNRFPDAGLQIADDDSLVPRQPKGSARHEVIHRLKTSDLTFDILNDGDRRLRGRGVRLNAHRDQQAHLSRQFHHETLILRQMKLQK